MKVADLEMSPGRDIYFSKTPSGDVVERATLMVILLATYVSRPKTGP